MSSIVTEESATLTDSPSYHLKHKWTVKDFASTYLADSAKEDYPELYSTWFSYSLNKAVQFRVNLSPRGENEKSQNYLSLHLEMKGNSPSPIPKSVYVKYKLSLLNERNEECSSEENRREFAYPSSNYGWHTFLKHTVLQDPVKGFLPSDTLTILAEVTVLPEPVSQLGNELLVTKLKVASIENVRASHANMLNSGENGDVILVVDGHEFRAHKSFLSAGSSLFRNMFNCVITKCRVEIADMKLEVAKEMCLFIYTGEVKHLAEYAEELLVAAHKYDVTQLKALCSQYLCGQVNTEKVASLFAFAHNHSVPQLKSTCVKYIRANLEAVILTPGWKVVHDLFTQELRQLYEKEEAEEKGKKRKTLEESESSN